MAHIVMADDGIVFDGRTLDERPLGGAETSFIEMANALAARGHDVHVYNKCEMAVTHRGVHWHPIGEGLPRTADLYIANRGDKLIRQVPGAKKTIFWIHNPAGYLLKWRYQWKLALRRPTIVFSGASHAGTYPAWGFAGGREIVLYGLTDLFCHATERAPPPPRAVFTSNPLRSLDWLLDVWESSVHPAIPAAQLHIFAGMATYGTAGQAKAGKMGPVLERAAALVDKGVVLRGPVPKAQLVDELAQARVLMYRGDIGETFCSAVAEAQAMGVPTVLEDIACMNERLIDGQTGFVSRGAADFAAHSIKLLADDTLWTSQHRTCLEHQRRWRWDDAAREFERIAGW
ncbi:glycosyltransferase family 4 protein [Magnetospirillum sp. J10]|uniref:Glycosyltransferase family 4 protein n=2 Tax=Magnetospirillum sulfuroxidans TaxID=611300 RepID=A0ABS5IH51_9PROT|nr:glycosyltransferase family 4 protein [Magnetospirillum sulfuroxidans]